MENKESKDNKEIKKVSSKKGSKLKKILISILLIAIIFFLYARFIATSGLLVKEYPIYSDNLPKSYDGVKIVQLSDIHYGTTINKKRLDKIVEEANSLKPDIVVFTGDLYDESIILNDNIKNEMIDSLSKLSSTIGKYAVIGNHDYSDPSFQTIIESSGFTYLNDTSKIIYHDGEIPIEIVGYKDQREDTPNYAYELTDLFKIALIHEPDAIDNLLDKNIDVALSGHSHGGQVRLPIIGALFTPLGSKKYYNEYYEVNNTKLYVSYGIGTSLIKLRLFDRPSINLYRLYKN